MNNLHRELAPISDAAWAQIDQEATRTLKRYLAARRVVDVPEPKGATLAAVGTGHTKPIDAPSDGVQAVRRAVNAVVELRVPFTLTRAAIDGARRAGGGLVILVGDAPYYARFGFTPVPPGRLTLPGPVDPARLLWLELADGFGAGASGAVEALGPTR